MSPRLIISLGALLAGLAVVIGAFGAHGLETALPQWYPTESEKLLATWEVGVRYQMYSGLGMILIGLWTRQQSPGRGTLAAGALLVGTLIFSGCLYALVLSRVKVLGAIVPIGGVAMIVGWVVFAWQALGDPTARGERGK